MHMWLKKKKTMKNHILIRCWNEITNCLKLCLGPYAYGHAFLAWFFFFGSSFFSCNISQRNSNKAQQNFPRMFLSSTPYLYISLFYFYNFYFLWQSSAWAIRGRILPLIWSWWISLKIFYLQRGRKGSYSFLKVSLVAKL